jgi:hypothetical protein
MRAILLLCVLVTALVSCPAPVSTSDDDPSPARPSHVYGRRNYAPQVNARNLSPPPKKRQDPGPRPSPKPPTWKRADEDEPPSRPKPSSRYVRRADDDPPRAKPSGAHGEYLLRRSAEVRSLEEQDVIGSDGAKGGPTWYVEDRCPAPLSACPVRGAPDADAYECVDLLSDLDSCGGCAADDIACVFLPFLLSVFPFFFFSPSPLVSLFFLGIKVAELNRPIVVSRRNLALTATPSPMHAASNVSLDSAKSARARKGMWLRQRAICVCASRSLHH